MWSIRLALRRTWFLNGEWATCKRNCSRGIVHMCTCGRGVAREGCVPVHARPVPGDVFASSRATYFFFCRCSSVTRERAIALHSPGTFVTAPLWISVRLGHTHCATAVHPTVSGRNAADHVPPLLQRPSPARLPPPTLRPHLCSWLLPPIVPLSRSSHRLSSATSSSTVLAPSTRHTWSCGRAAARTVRPASAMATTKSVT